jgi:hypothetical protein
MFVTTPHYLAALAPRTRLARLSARGVPLPALAATWMLATVAVLLGNLAELCALIISAALALSASAFEWTVAAFFLVVGYGAHQITVGARTSDGR